MSKILDFEIEKALRQRKKRSDLNRLKYIEKAFFLACEIENPIKRFFQKRKLKKIVKRGCIRIPYKGKVI